MAKISAVVKQYNRVRNNLKRKIKSMEKRGFFLPGDRELTEILPAKPQKITEGSIRRLEKINATIYEKSVWYDLETHELYSGRKGQQILRQRAAEKAAETRARKKRIIFDSLPDEADIIINNFKNLILSFGDTEFGYTLLEWLNSMLSEHGKYEVALMIRRAESAGVQLTFRVLAYREAYQDFITSLLNYFPTQGILGTEEFFEKIEHEELVEWESM